MHAQVVDRKRSSGPRGYLIQEHLDEWHHPMPKQVAHVCRLCGLKLGYIRFFYFRGFGGCHPASRDLDCFVSVRVTTSSSLCPPRLSKPRERRSENDRNEPVGCQIGRQLAWVVMGIGIRMVQSRRYRRKPLIQPTPPSPSLQPKHLPLSRRLSSSHRNSGGI